MKNKAETKINKPSSAETRAPAGLPPLQAEPGESFSSPTLNWDDLQILKAPFPKESLGIKVQSTSKDRTRAMLVLYLGHTDVQNRLEMVDPAWTSEVIAEERVGDSVYVRIRMTVKNVSRENVGEGGDPKAAYSDALKRAAMLFGIGRYLYDSPTVWADYNESKDRFRTWTIADYEKAAQGQYVTPTPSAEIEAGLGPSSRVIKEKVKKPITPRTVIPVAENAEEAPAGLTTGSRKTSRSREQLNRLLMNLYRPYLTKFPDTRFVELLHGRYNVGETRLMTLEQIEDLVRFMEQQLAAAA